MFDFLLKSNFPSIPVNDIDALIGKMELIDIREHYEYQGGSLKTARNIPMNQLLTNPEQYLKKDKTYHIICQSGGRSRNACTHLAKLGYQVINVSGGIGSYVGTKRK